MVRSGRPGDQAVAFGVMAPSNARRLRRLAEELEESGLPPDGHARLRDMLLDEIDQALRPPVHERHVPSRGTILEPTAPPAQWASGTQLDMTRAPLRHQPLVAARRFADGLSSWLLRRVGDDEEDEWVVFDRPAGSERDLVVLGRSFGATIVQRHPRGTVRVAGNFGVLRWEGLRWHHEPPVSRWSVVLTADRGHGDPAVLEAMLAFAVHDLGSLGIGALLVYRPDAGPGPSVEERLAIPPPLRVRQAPHLAPLRHALSQVDGAAIFDAEGTLRQIGVRLVPSRAAEALVEGLRGTRHTSARRYSYDDPSATVVVVSEDGPVTVLRGGAILEPPARE